MELIPEALQNVERREIRIIQKKRVEEMRPVSRVVYFSIATINCISDAGDKSGESSIPEAKRNCFKEVGV